MVLAEYRGITVGDLTKLRAKAREQQVYLRVLKNTLAPSLSEVRRSLRWQSR